MNNIPEGITILSAVEATGAGSEFDVSEYESIGVLIVGHDDGGSGEAQGKVRCQGSFEWRKNINFSADASVTNPWAYVSLGEYETAQININGALFSQNDVRLFEINTKMLRTINFSVTEYTDGAFTVKVYPLNKRKV